MPIRNDREWKFIKTKAYINFEKIPPNERYSTHTRFWTKRATSGPQFLVFALCILLSFSNCLLAGLLRNRIYAILVFPISLGFALHLYMSIYTGISASSNGIYLRFKEPIRYWLNIAVVVLIIAALNYGAWHLD